MNRLHLAYHPMNLLVALVMAAILGGCRSPAKAGTQAACDCSILPLVL